MLTTKECPKCKSAKIITGLRIVDRSHLHMPHDLHIQVYDNPDAIIFKGTHKGRLLAFVCGECSYTEMYLENARELYEAYSEYVEKTSKL